MQIKSLSAANHLTDDSITMPVKEPLQVRIPVAVKRAFKAHAALQGIEPNELFVEVWKYYQTNFNTKQDEAKNDKK